MEQSQKPQFNPMTGLAYLEVVNHLRYFQWYAIGVTFCLFISLGVLAIKMATSDNQVHYVAFAEDKDIHFKVLPAPLDKRQELLLIRQQLREYVHNRAYIDNYTESIRFPKAFAMNTPEENERFKYEYNRIKSESSFERRDVKVVSDIALSDGIHQLELETIDHFQGERYKNYWTVVMKYELRRHKVSVSNEHLNPLGLTITGYQITKKDITYEGKPVEIN